MGRLELRAITGTYEKNGETKKRYATIGNLWTDEDGKPQSIVLETVPVNWEGKAYVSEPYQKDRPLRQDEALSKAQDVVIEDIDNKPIDLSDIPF